MSFLILIRMPTYTKNTYFGFKSFYARKHYARNLEFMWSYFNESAIRYNLRNGNRL